MITISVVEHVLPHYRRDVFNGLTKLDKFSFEFVAGDDYKNIKSLYGDRFVILKYRKLKLGKHEFYFLRRILKYIINKRPDAIICTGFDLHQVHTIFIFFLQKMILRKKLYWWSHGTNGNQGTVGLAIRSFFYRYSDGILAYSCKAQENLHRMGVRDTKIQVVNNSLNFDDYGFLLNDIHSKRSQESLKILFCGRITKSKKIHLLIEAVGILKSRDNINAKCTIIGNGELSELSRLASKHNVTELIHFTGENYGFDLHKYFLESDIFVYPGGIGLSIVQALSFGLPVITTDNIALHGPEIELLEAGITGDFFKDDSAEQLADTIKIWASKISDPTNNIRENAVKKIIELGYLPDVMIDKINGFLEKEFAVNQTRIYV